jgi:hypothetical protein
MELGETEGAMSSLSIVVTGMLTLPARGFLPVSVELNKKDISLRICAAAKNILPVPGPYSLSDP